MGVPNVSEKRRTLIFFLPLFLWYAEAWMKPESQNYLMEKPESTLGGNGVRSFDLDGLWGQEFAVKRASQMILKQ